MHEIRVASPNGGITWYAVDGELPPPGFVEVPNDISVTVEVLDVVTMEESNKVITLGRIVFDPVNLPKGLLK